MQAWHGHYRIVWNDSVLIFKPRGNEHVLYLQVNKKQREVRRFRRLPLSITCFDEESVTATATPDVTSGYSPSWSYWQPVFAEVPLEMLGFCLLIRTLHFSHQGYTRH